MSNRRHPNVANVDELEGRAQTKGSRFAATMKRFGPHVGSKSLGCTHYTIEPGKTAFPHHFHCVTEEALFILAGEGTLRIGNDTVSVRVGDWIAFPVGPEHAHQLTNTGTTPLQYLGLSANAVTADIVGYPDSKKVAAMAWPSTEALGKGVLPQPERDGPDPVLRTRGGARPCRSAPVVSTRPSKRLPC